jgi:TPP-dependent pyruvate/acetoin dehydrogenase alpha subunit
MSRRTTPARTGKSSHPRSRNGGNLPHGLSAEQMLALDRQMVLLRKFELAAQKACHSGETPGFLHL